MLKEVLRLAMLPAFFITTTCAHPQRVELRGTPLSAENARELTQAARRVAGDRYQKVVVTITDRVVAVRR
jgi:hypothetical protein